MPSSDQNQHRLCEQLLLVVAEAEAVRTALDGFDAEPQAGGLFRLLCDARRAVPGARAPERNGVRARCLNFCAAERQLMEAGRLMTGPRPRRRVAELAQDIHAALDAALRQLGCGRLRRPVEGPAAAAFFALVDDALTPLVVDLVTAVRVVRRIAERLEKREECRQAPAGKRRRRC